MSGDNRYIRTRTLANDELDVRTFYEGTRNSNSKNRSSLGGNGTRTKQTGDGRETPTTRMGTNVYEGAKETLGDGGGADEDDSYWAEESRARRARRNDNAKNTS